MTYDEWIKGTNAGIFTARSQELRAIDRALEAHNKAQTLYAQQWTAQEVRIALEKWKAKQGPGWPADERNRTRLIERLDRELPPLRLIGNGYGTVREGESAEHLRKGALFVLSRCMTSPLPSSPMDFLNDGTDTSSDIQAFVETGRAGGWRYHDGSFYDHDNKKNGFLESLSETLIGYIKDLARLAHLDEFAADAAKFIIDGLGELLTQVFGSLLGKLTAVVDITKGLKQAASAAVGVWRTRLVSEGVLTGHPRIVIESVRDQIKNSGYDGIKSAAKAGALAGLSMIPGAGTVIGAIASAIASVWAFVTKVFDQFRELKKLRKVFAEAVTHYHGGLHQRAAEFNRWFRESLKDLPILSSYCMTMPLLGSYYGFLTLISADGQEMSYKQLERNYALFNDVKSWARKFVKEHPVRLRSDNIIVQHSIEAARGERQHWVNAKSGVVARIGKVAIGVIETAVGDVAKRG